MKKQVFLLAIMLFLGISMSAQFSFGLNAGYNNLNFKSKVDNISASTDGSGFFLGLNSFYELSNGFELEGDVNYMNNEDTNYLQIPILLKYYISESDFNLQVGPQMTIVLENSYGLYDNFGLDFTFGLGYDITEHFFVFGRYALEVTNRTSDGVYYYDPYSYESYNFDAKSRLNSLNFGIGYKF
ncbi:outer membrane beta-barrel protein [Zunongwangia sp.]|uniref:outer membrane beta-barrel protein n=1 Tax=Zunongwangia sp. TaxID=1965325 RepID=UPI003AA966BF